MSAINRSKKCKDTNAAPFRKLRKSCSLPTCKSSHDICMHCTCDGRCGRHAGGHCGGRREGSGRGCKREGCTRDDRCLHSNRATCCHCRNLVSSSGRAAKRPRVMMPQVQMQSRVQPLLPLGCYQQMPVVPAVMPMSKPEPSAMSDEAELHAFLQEANLDGELALCEYKEWSSRSQYCNLVVLVCGTRFNLHKHPMLLESNRLHRMACQVVETGGNNNNPGGAVPVLELSTFPGGAEVFETLAIYCYTGEISFSMANLAAMNCAIEVLEMRDDIRQSAKRFLDHQVSCKTGGLSSLLQVATAAQTLAQVQPELFHSVCAALKDKCMCALVERSGTLDANTMLELLTLPSELFIEFTQRVLSSKLPPSSAIRSTTAIATELCVQAKLAQLHKDAQRQNFRSSHCSHLIAHQCVQLLQGEPIEANDAIKAKEVKTYEEEPLDLTMQFSSEVSGKMLLEIIDHDLRSILR